MERRQQEAGAVSEGILREASLTYIKSLVDSVKHKDLHVNLII